MKTKIKQDQKITEVKKKGKSVGRNCKKHASPG